MQAEFDEGGAIGRRYRRQDEIGTPWAVTIDHQSLEDGTVTIRDRDTLAQERVAIDELGDELERRLRAPWTLAEDPLRRRRRRRRELRPSPGAAGVTAPRLTVPAATRARRSRTCPAARSPSDTVALKVPLADVQAPAGDQLAAAADELVDGRPSPAWRASTVPDTRTGALEASARVSTGSTPMTTRLETDAGLRRVQRAQHRRLRRPAASPSQLPSAPVATRRQRGERAVGGDTLELERRPGHRRGGRGLVSREAAAHRDRRAGGDRRLRRGQRRARSSGPAWRVDVGADGGQPADRARCPGSRSDRPSRWPAMRGSSTRWPGANGV